MSEKDNRAMIERYWDLAKADPVAAVERHYNKDVVVEYPQSGERIDGKENYLEMYRNYPGESPSFTPSEIRVAGDLAIAEHDGKYPDGSRWFGVSIYELKGGEVFRETSYFSQGFEAPDWRASWVKKS